MTDNENPGIYITTEDREFKSPKGRISMTLRHIDDDPEGFILTGLLQTSAFITKLVQLETMRYVISDIEIIACDLGSHSDDIIYNFRAKTLEWKY